MTQRDRERAAVRQLRDALNLSRPEFAQVLTTLGYEVSGSTIEQYEKEVPPEARRIMAAHARKHGLDDIADVLVPTPPSAGTADSGKTPITTTLQFDILSSGIPTKLAELGEKMDLIIGLLREPVKHGRVVTDTNQTPVDLKGEMERLRPSSQRIKRLEKRLGKDRKDDRPGKTGTSGDAS